MPDIVVTGQRIKVETTPPASAGYHYTPMGGSYFEIGGGGTSGWDQSEQRMLKDFSERTEEADDTPCISAPPEGFTKAQINNHAKAVGSELKQYPGTTFEYSSIIYAEGNQIAQTALFTSGSVGRVAVDTDAVPTGATIIGVIHNHPDRGLEIDKAPSPADIGVLADLRNMSAQPGARFQTSPQALMYIFDGNSEKTYVYDNLNMANNTPSCHLG